MVTSVRYNVSLSTGIERGAGTATARPIARKWMANGKGLGAGYCTAFDRRCTASGGYSANPMNLLDAKSVRWSPAARLDMFAVSLSTLCVLHCVALPVLLAVMPVAAQAAENELVHRVLVLAAVPVSLRVVWKALPVEGNRLFVAAALGGLGLLLLGAFVEALSRYEQPITVAGGVLLGSAHLWHWVRRCGRSDPHSVPG